MSIFTPGPGNLSSAAKPHAWRRHVILLSVLSVLLLICFSGPLYDLAGFSLDSDFFSYIPLMPFITGYLIWLRRPNLTAGSRPAWGLAAAAFAAGGGVLAAYARAVRLGWHPVENDYLAAMMLAFLLLLLAAGFLSLGKANLAAIAFPVALLIFMVPYPEKTLDGIESFFQHTSAVAAHGFFSVAGTACQRDDLVLNLPHGIGLEVAPECSGIHSSQVLLITSLLAGNLFLVTAWRRAVLAVFVIPLAILRNGFRVFVIGEMCVHIGPEQINSPIHRQGGPLFFALSLIPFFFFLVWLRKSESNAQKIVKPVEV